MSVTTQAAYTAILIHTSVKLVTSRRAGNVGRKPILIHTSVKLVTATLQLPFHSHLILIHTSVKLVTSASAGIAA